jgi:hypothetical protein
MLKFARSRKDLEQARVALWRYNAMWPETMTEIRRADWPTDLEVPGMLAPPLQVWRSRYFIAILHDEAGKSARRLSVQRTSLNDEGEIEGGITWDELMHIKSECGFGDVDAVELYPRNVDVVNIANMRHLWILPTLSDLAWRSAISGDV